MKFQHLLTLSVLFAVIFVFSPNTVSAKDEWMQVRSKNFNLIGNASERDIRKVATKLEQFRETFRLLFKQTDLSSPIPTNVVVFKNSASYKPFKPVRADGKTDNFIAGYFQPGDDVNYITLSTEGENADVYGTIFHEYVHFIINTNYGKSEVPPWFNEGLAEYYQTFAIEKDQEVKLGLPQSGHLQLLQQNKLIPLDTFFNISNYALHQNGNHSRSVFYAQAWALIHYLVQGGKTDGLGKFLTLRLQNVPAEKAFQDAFQTSYVQMEKDLKKYVEQNTYKYSIITLNKKLVFDNEMQVSPLSEAVTNAYLGDLLYHTNRADDAEAYLQKAVASQPDLSMAHTTYGMVKLRQRKFDEAKKYLEKAVSEDQRNHLAFYQYAYLLSREARDEFGYVSSFPADKTVKMRDLLKKAIAINPSFTESYELLAFLGLVNNEHLDEAISYLQKALKFQPGNQRYVLRIAEIYLRQDKFKEAADITDKIAKTADEPEIKARAENLAGQLRQRQEFEANREAARKQYEAAMSEARKNGAAPILIRGSSNEKPMTPEERAKAQEEAEIRAANEAIRKAVAGEKQVIGRIERIECKGKTIIYTVKAENETFTLTSKDFESLALTSFLPETAGAEVGCESKIAAVNAVLTYKLQTDAKALHRGELIAIDFVAKNFRFMDTSVAQNETEFVNLSSGEAPPAPINNQDFEGQRREAIMRSIKNAMRQPLEGEKREIGFIEKIECNNKGMFFYLKTQTQTFKFTAASPQSVVLRAFTSEVEQLQFGCGMKQVDVPVVFTYKEESGKKNNTNGEIVALEFVPKSFTLEK
ncbi:MAG: tetratricopeptide repeat protein [Acidobacteriota bacterium]|nr:tetratricopeptide repeat protein [Acidobacteriota bacterium]